MSAEARPTIDELVLADDPAAWRALGFTVDDDGFRVGSVAIRFDDGERHGIVGWALRDATSDELDGLPTIVSARAPGPPGEHPNGARQIDHVVVLTPELERTTDAIERAGARLRRVREAGDVRQGFHRLGEVILEVVESPKASGPARFWGLVFVVDDLDRTAELLGERLGEIRDAVQPERRIATVPRSAGLAVPVAFMTP